MTHVTFKRLETGAHELTIDGFDMSMHTLAEGITITPDKELGPTQVSIVVLADTIDVDLPESVIEALRASDEDAA